ncbi:MAG: HipA family kinase [Prosthecobacter sp.]|uniref:HipA family kinase n=1 Tax=Prosthecobacter sp. TaxID=1965333 RepID=UPI0038FDCDEA
MNATLAITEILGRSEQGMTRPFICRAGALIHYVKGRYAGQRSLCCEWIAGRAAQFLLDGLPLAIPPLERKWRPK